MPNENPRNKEYNNKDNKVIFKVPKIADNKSTTAILVIKEYNDSKVYRNIFTCFSEQALLFIK